jgi:hypothetical protein
MNQLAAVGSRPRGKNCFGCSGSALPFDGVYCAERIRPLVWVGTSLRRPEMRLRPRQGRLVCAVWFESPLYQIASLLVRMTPGPLNYQAGWRRCRAGWDQKPLFVICSLYYPACHLRKILRFELLDLSVT